jgi:hypothetical protein
MPGSGMSTSFKSIRTCNPAATSQHGHIRFHRSLLFDSCISGLSEIVVRYTPRIRVWREHVCAVTSACLVEDQSLAVLATIVICDVQYARANTYGYSTVISVFAIIILSVVGGLFKVSPLPLPLLQVPSQVNSAPANMSPSIALAPLSTRCSC